MTKEMEKILEQNKNDNKFKYMLLDRMRSDCKYFLGYGNRNDNVLWSGNASYHIDDMKALYNSLQEKPSWITMEDIENYRIEMGA